MGALDPKSSSRKSLTARLVRHRAVLSGSQLRRPHPPYAKQVSFWSPPLVVYAIAGTVRLDIENDVGRGRWQGDSPEPTCGLLDAEIES